MARGNDADCEDARTWIMYDGDEFMTFRWYCFHLGLSPVATRKGMVESTERDRIWLGYILSKLSARAR